MTPIDILKACPFTSQGLDLPWHAHQFQCKHKVSLSDLIH